MGASTASSVQSVFSDVSITQVNDKVWKLVSDLNYQGDQGTYIVPTGFETDLASVPRHFVWLFQTYGRYTQAAILHDWLIKDEPTVNRSQADHIFRLAMLELKVPFVRRWMMWAAVRAGGHLSYTRPTQLLSWIFVFLPSFVFLAIPFFILTVWLGLFKVIEVIFYVILKPFSRQPSPNVLPEGRIITHGE
ncbi:DUF1353 domain-containing protein [Streptomyces sp. NPDC001581]|uniref:DUF1353 domain-containing protein n=1 Tax=Streptomyces sp. NPDC001581 TaxID=3154386 RepID=UPI0033255642